MKNILLALLLLVTTFFILVALEIICVLSTNSLERNASPFINLEAIRMQSYAVEGVVDPLLGFAFEERFVQKYAGKIKYDSAILPNSQKGCEDTLSILITGGSTSDIIEGLGKWGGYFQKKLSENNICATVKIAATPGYHSGQELLKTIKYYSFYQPDIHISYSGVNEPNEYRYTTKYEEKILLGRVEPKSFVLPYTVHIFRKILGLKLNAVNLRLDVPEMESYKFWEQNMSLMQGIAIENNSKFFAILQPVLGVGPHENQAKEVYAKGRCSSDFSRLEQSVKDYREFYEKAIEICTK